jgi:DNA-binding response OmpR family regulator
MTTTSTNTRKPILYVGNGFSEAQLDAVGVKGAVDLDAALVNGPADTEVVLHDLRSHRLHADDVRRLRARMPRCSVIALVDASKSVQVRLDAMKAGCDDVLVISYGESASSLIQVTERLCGTSLRRRKILVVDDEENNRELLRQELTDVNFDVILTTNGHTALSRAAQADLVLLDIMMPGMDGREVCRRLRAEPATKKLPIIMVSALGEIKNKLEALELGANDYVTKPYDADALIDKVRRLLRQSAAQGSRPR